MPASLLVVERDLSTARALAQQIEEASTGIRVAITPSVNEALDSLRFSSVDCLLLGDAAAEMSALDCIRCVRDLSALLPVIVVSSAGCEEVAVEAMKLGATDYVARRNGYVPGLVLRIRQAIGGSRLDRLVLPAEPTRSSARALPAELRERYARAGIVGTSPRLLDSITLAERAGDSDVPVVIEGETGTGKEMFARAIHLFGRRARKPFLAQNCAAFADGVLESELFGHVRGAFTGASSPRRGLFEAASGGTLFFDEISELGASIQAKLLRVLQEGEVRPLGSNETRRVDVRVIAASNRDLRIEVERGRFRADLYHRLNVLNLHLPPLRERSGDVPLLAAHFLAEAAHTRGGNARSLTPGALKRLEHYAWPGNVRELRNEIQRLVLCADGREQIAVELLAPRIRAQERIDRVRDRRPLREILRDVEVATILTRLREHGYSRARTARSLGIARETLWAKMRQHGCETTTRSPMAAARDARESSE